MSLPVPEIGLVIRYSYLWHEEYEEGLEEGGKDRPCAIITAVRKNEDNKLIVTVLPITHTKPANISEAVEIPARIKRQLGLDDEQSWIMVNEVNRFLWPGPDLRPITKFSDDRFSYGILPPSFFRKVREQFLSCMTAQNMRITLRSD